MNKINLEDKNCWVITEGLIGTQNQCVGVAEALGMIPEIKQIQLNQPWRLVSPPLLFPAGFSFSPRLNPPWPDLLIASGRKSVAASVYIKKKSQGECFTLQIQDPRVSASHFDMVAVPSHDRLRGPNVVVTDGAPNKVTPHRLAEAKEKFLETFAPFPPPRIGVLIGGTSKAYTMSSKDAQRLVHQLKDLRARTQGSLMITASRRTGENNMALLKEHLTGQDIYFWNNQGENPYLGILAWADVLLVTEDSVSMLSEAATTGKPVYKISLTGDGRRINKFHKHLKSKSILRDFKGGIDFWHYEPLNDSQKIADELFHRIKAH